MMSKSPARFRTFSSWITLYGWVVVDFRQSESHRRAGRQVGRSLRIAAGEQGDMVPLPHKFFGEIRDNPLGSAVKLWRDALNQGRDLGYSHSGNSFSPSYSTKLPECRQGSSIAPLPSIPESNNSCWQT